MSRALLFALLALAAPSRAQEGFRAAGAAEPVQHVFEIADGLLHLDGRTLPTDAIPPGVDLRGIGVSLEYSGPVTPVVEIDGEPYVLENERLIPFAASSKANSAVYIMGDVTVAPETAPAERLAPAVDAAYMQRLSEADRALYDKVEHERALELGADALAARIRAMPEGPDRDGLVARLRERLAQAFDLKHEIRREEITRAEDDLRALRAVLDERDAMRGDIVERRLRHLLGE